MAVPTNHYPRATPYHSTEELAAQTVRLRRWTYRLIAAAAGLVVLSVAAVVFVKNQANAGVATPGGAAAEIAVAPPPSSNSAEPAPVKETKPKAPAAAPTFPQRDRFLEALGGLSAAHLYQSYLNIGMLADGVESEAYTVQEAEKLLTSVIDLMNRVDAQLVKIGQTGLDGDDQASLERIKSVSALLRLQTRTLQTYWASGEKTQAERYHRAREAAWTGLTKVLGFEE